MTIKLNEVVRLALQVNFIFIQIKQIFKRNGRIKIHINQNTQIVKLILMMCKEYQKKPTLPHQIDIQLIWDGQKNKIR